jgi:hypothetical protein
MGPAVGLEGRGGETLNVGIFGTVLLWFVCGAIEEVTLRFDLSTVEDTVDFDDSVATKISSRKIGRKKN